MQRAPNILGIDFSTSNSAASKSIRGNLSSNFWQANRPYLRLYFLILKAGKQSLALLPMARLSAGLMDAKCDLSNLFLEHH